MKGRNFVRKVSCPVNHSLLPSPIDSNYSPIIGLNEHSYGALPRFEETLESYLFPEASVHHTHYSESTRGQSQENDFLSRRKLLLVSFPCHLNSTNYQLTIHSSYNRSIDPQTRAGSSAGTGGSVSLDEGGYRTQSSSEKDSGFYKWDFIVPKKGGGIASHTRSLVIEPHVQVQDQLYRDSNQI